MRTALLRAAALTALAVAVAGCSATRTSGVIAADQPVGPAASAAPAGPTETTSPAAGPRPSGPAAPSAAPLPSYDVKAVQRQLTTLRYYAGPIDGAAGPSTASAVMAFQKVQGIGADGIVGQATLTALKAPRSAQLKASAPASRVEVDLTRQVLYVVKGGAIARIMPVSSGNGATYLQKDGRTAKALSPVGWYRIERRIIGPEVADLGTLYDPQYFYRGWAIHGSDSVPAYPASHGCIRVPRPDAKYLLAAIGIGTPVFLYGGQYTFAAGSSAPGTDTPTGDAAGGRPSPSPRPAATAAPKPTATPSPSPKVSPSARPSPAPSPSPSPSR